MFFNLHQHTTYSFLDGYGLPSQYLDRISEVGTLGMALTEHGNVYSHVPFTAPFKKAGRHLVYGCEMYIVPELVEDRLYYHITVLAKTSEGYANLLKLVNMSNHQFYYKPRITFQQLLENSEGLIILSGCCCDGFLVKNKERDQEKVFEAWLKGFLKMEWFIELQPFKDEQTKWDKLTDLAQRYGIPTVVTADAHYPAPKHKEVQDLQLAVNTARPLSDPDRLKMEYPLWLPSTEEMMERCREMGVWNEEMVHISEKIALSCQVELPRTSMIKLGTQTEGLRKKCLAALRRMGNSQEYLERMDYELQVLDEKGFNDYFTIISDVVSWAKKRMLVGAGRGSSAGSLVCYLLGITEVDPLVYGLMFERFIDINRSDLPDIDLDFPASDRDKVIAYLRKKYGEKNTSQLITFSTFRPRAVLQDVARAIGVPPWELKEANTQFVERGAGEDGVHRCLADSIPLYPKLRELFDKHPTFYKALDIEGQVRQSGTHAAAVVLSSEPLEAIGSINKDGAFGIDKYSIEKYGLLKIDILGVETLNVIQDVCLEAEFDSSELYRVNLEDERVYSEVFKAGKLIGVFQFEGAAVQKVSNELRPATFNQLVHITALSRPGPLNSGATAEYIRRAKGEPYLSDPILDPYTSETFGVIIYQEQVMQIVRELGGLSWEDVNAIRKGMGKSMGEEYLNKYREKFVEGAEKVTARDRAHGIWNQICTYGSYGFNKSHAVCYAMLSFWTAYCKAYWPNRFYARILRNEIDPSVVKPILREWGGEIISLDLNQSKEYFRADGDRLIGGFTNIKGIGEKAAKALVKGQPYASLEDLKARMHKGVGKAVEEGPQWADLSTLYDKVKDQLPPMSCQMKTFEELAGIPGSIRGVVSLGRVLEVSVRDHNEESKVQKRGYAMSAPTMYTILKVEDDAGGHRVFFDRYFTQRNEDVLKAAHGRICLFRLDKEDGGLLKGVKILALEGV